MNFEQCEPAKATHVRLADGRTKLITDRKAGLPWDQGFRLENQNPYVSVEAIECLGGSFVREVVEPS